MRGASALPQAPPAPRIALFHGRLLRKGVQPLAGQPSATSTTCSGVATTSYSCNPQQADIAIQTLAKALQGDPSTSYWCRDGSAGLSFYQTILSATVKEHPDARQILCTDGGQAAAICHFYPDESRGIGDDAQASSSNQPNSPAGPMLSMLVLYATVLLSMRPRRWLEAVIVGDVFERYRSAFAASIGGAFIHLVALGVLPSMQQKGLGTRLLQHITATAEELGMWVYVEASSDGSKVLYERTGFKVLRVVQHHSSAPVTYIMAYRPRAKAQQGSSAQNDGL